MASRIFYIAANTETCWLQQDMRLVEDSAPTQGSTAVVVLDIADESHVVDSMPLMRAGHDATLLSRRRLAREFPGATLATLLPVRKRRREGLAHVVLIAADTGAKHAARIEQLAGQHCLRGVYTPALLVAEWLRRAGQKERQVLVVLPTPAGLRLVFVDQGRPLLSRLMPLADGDAVAVEIGRTVQYLRNTQRVSRDMPVQLWFWGVPQALLDACLQVGESCLAGVTPVVPGLPDPARGGFQALLQLVASRPAPDQLAPQSLRVGWFALLVRRWALGAAAAALVLGITLAILITGSAAQIRTGTNALRAEAAEAAAARSALEAGLQQRGLSYQDVQDMPEAETALRGGEVGLSEVLEVAGRLFGAQPEVSLNTLEFHSAPVATAERGDRPCGGNPMEAGATIEADFTLAEHLDVRARAQSLATVRAALLAPGRWRSTPDAAAMDQRQPLVARAGTDSGTEVAEWTACLLREAGA